ncbi:hypothetical protein ACHAWF_008982 [Thalassiosira exigua]
MLHGSLSWSSSHPLFLLRSQQLPDERTGANAVQNILSNKPLSCDDVHSLDAARKELRRVRKLMDTFKRSQGIDKKKADGKAIKKGARNAIHEEEHIDDYVKVDVPKSSEVRDIIHAAVRTNVLFENNTEDELREIVDVFEPCSFATGDPVISQGEKGDDFFVVEAGELSIAVRMAPAEGEEEGDLMDQSVNEIKVGNYQDGSAFGELALIYGSPRAATIKATEDCKLWRIKRSWYRGVVGQHRRKLHKEKVEFLPRVNVGNRSFGDIFSKNKVDTMAQLLNQEYFRKGDAILREGEAGNTFYIIQSGEVDVYKKELGEQPIATLGKEKFFGEKALLSDDVRGATVVASSPVVVCYVMTRGDFTRVLGNLQDIMDGKVGGRPSSAVFAGEARKKVKYGLEELQSMNVLGQGAFGKVKLVKAKETGECYALKLQSKKFVVDNKQKEYIMREIHILRKLDHPNILVLHCAMQDPKYIYLLLDLLPGGELMDILQRKGKFSEEMTRFYAASVVLAYTAFHEKNIAYRDLKPENLVLDDKGYCVVVDMGLAKELTDGPTYTFCGTPDYIAPELIRGTGYNWAVDYWALGVLLYELHSGGAPFQSYDPTGTAKKVLKGRVSFPSKFSSNIQRVIKELLAKDPTRRLGCMNDGVDGVMKHRFFQGFDWKGLLGKTLPPPYKPQLPKNVETIGRKDDGKDKAKATKWFPDLD